MTRLGQAPESPPHLWEALWRGEVRCWAVTAWSLGWPRTLEDEPAGTVNIDEFRPRHRQIPGVRGLRQASAGNSAGNAGWKLLGERGQSKDRVPWTRTLWQPDQKTPVSTPWPMGAAEQAFREALAPLFLGPFL